MATINLSDDEREDIRFALAKCATRNRESAEKIGMRGYEAIGRTLLEQADRFEALARKVTMTGGPLAVGSTVRHRREGWYATVASIGSGEVVYVRRDEGEGLVSVAELEVQ